MSRRIKFAKRVAYLAIAGVSIYLVMPSVIATFSSWPEVKKLREGSLLMMVGATLASLVCFWILLGLCLRTRRWLLVAASQLASGAIGRIVPGGAATATAVQYRLLRDAGINSSEAGTGMTVATLLNFAVLFAMPVLAVPSILFGPPIDSLLVNGAVAAAISFVAAAILGGLFFMWDRPLAALGRTIDAIVRRLGRNDPDDEPREIRLIRSRDLIRSHLADRWYKVVLASCGKWGFDYLALILAVRGVGHDDTSSVFLLAFVTASLLAKVPFTPGGLGFVEAGLTGTLVLAGMSAGDAATATLAYRLVSYWLPIPLGGLAYAMHLVHMRRQGVELDPLIDRDTGEAITVPEASSTPLDDQRGR